jgi:hypothetical protein
VDETPGDDLDLAARLFSVAADMGQNVTYWPFSVPGLNQSGRSKKAFSGSRPKCSALKKKGITSYCLRVMNRNRDNIGSTS